MAHPGPAPKPPVRHPTQDDTRRVLIVDDDRRVSELLQITFQGRGFAVETCRDALSALRRLHDTEREPPDLVVADLQLQGANGPSLFSRIREEPSMADLPVIVISGQVAMETRIQVLKWGADDLVVKPFSPRELILRAQKILDRTGKLRRLEQRLSAVENDLSHERDARSGAHRAQRLFRRGFVDGIAQLAESFREGRPVEEGLAHLIARRWGGGPFAYLGRDDAGTLRPAISRGVSTTVLAGLSVRAGTGEVVAPVGPVVFAEDIGEGNLLSPLRPALEAAGLSTLVVSWVGSDLVGILALGDGAVDAEYVAEEADLARCFALAHHALESRGREARADTLRFARWLAAWLGADESRSRRWKGHSARVAAFCTRLGRAIGLAGAELEQVTLAGAIHRVSVPKPAPCARPAVLRALADDLGGAHEHPGIDGFFAILRHQGEWWDGTGAPDGLAGTSIPVGARILAVADACALELQSAPGGSTRAADALRRLSGTRFDPDLVDLVTGGALSG